MNPVDKMISQMEEQYRSEQWRNDPAPVSDRDQRWDRREIERNRVGHLAVSTYMLVVMGAVVYAGVRIIQWIARGSL